MKPLDWSIRSVYHSLGNKFDLGLGWSMDSFDGELYIDYLKPKGKVVLDIGANNGDSAKLFLDHGAKRVICIEINPHQAKKIKKNLPGNNVEVICQPFGLFHLGFFHDCAKIDIEGAEAILLLEPKMNEKMKPTILEVHSQDLIKRFRANGWHFITYLNSYDLAMFTNLP